MCGITGFLYKRPDHYGPVGEVQVRMLEPLFRRGPDSAGVALYGRPDRDFVLRARVSHNGDGNGDGAGEEGRALAAIERLAKVDEISTSGDSLRVRVDYDGELGALARRA